MFVVIYPRPRVVLFVVVGVEALITTFHLDPQTAPSHWLRRYVSFNFRRGGGGSGGSGQKLRKVKFERFPPSPPPLGSIFRVLELEVRARGIKRAF